MTTTTVTTSFTLSVDGVHYVNRGNSLYVVGCEPDAKELTIPESSGGMPVVGMQGGAFAGSSAETIMLPELIAYLPDGAFFNAAHLKTVKFSSKIETIPSYCFDGCAALTTLPTSSIKSIYQGAFRGCKSLNTDSWENLNYFNSNAFEDCTSLTAFTIPDGISSVPNSAFAGCTALKEIRIPKTCEHIGYGAFCGCSSLVSVVLPERLTYVNDEAFAGCTALESFTSMAKESFSLYANALVNCPNLKELTYHSSYLSFSSFAFGYQRDADGNYTKNAAPVNIKGLYNQNLDVLIQDGIITFTPDGLTYHVIPDTDQICIDFITKPEGVSSNSCYIPAVIDGKTVAVIGNGSPCADENSFQSINIPDSVTEIGDYAFLYCRSLQYLNLNSDSQLSRIGLQAFYGTALQNTAQMNHGVIWYAGILYRCFTSEEQYEVPDTCKTIAADAFAHNNACKQIVLPDSVTDIDAGAFYSCVHLETITLPDSVVSIGTGAFVDCTALKSAAFGSGVKEIGSDLFTGCTALETVTAPKGSDAEKWCRENGFAKSDYDDTLYETV